MTLKMPVACERTAMASRLAECTAMLFCCFIAAAPPAAWADEPADTPAVEAESDPFAPAAALRMASIDDVREAALDWLAGQGTDAHTQAAAAELWGDEIAGGDALLERLVETLAFGSPAAAELAAVCQQSLGVMNLPDVAWLLSEDQPPLVRNNLRLYYGRWLAQNLLYDEAHGQLAELDPKEVVDPATLLFYQAVVAHRLLHREAGLKALAMLNHDVADCPQRYRALASLMEIDLKGLEDESLDHIARRMEDIRRRLGLGHAGPKVREVEDGVIASLDKLIDEMEQQQQQQQQQASSGGGSTQPSNPAPDSGVLGGSGPGDTNKRNIGNESGWGALPPKERQQAMQQIGKDFPSHYRDVVEQYFRKLASEESGSANPK